MHSAFPESRTEPNEIVNPEFRTCPRCAEDIRFAAKSFDIANLCWILKFWDWG